MKSLLTLAVTILVGTGAPRFSPAFGEKVDPQQSTTAAAADQATKPAEPKGGSTLIGCLSGPDHDGKYTLRSMEHRSGVEVFGLDELKSDSGGKVKLTGSWKPADQSQQSGSAKKERSFEATKVELMAETCQSPSTKTPVSKQKQEKQQQKQKESANAPTSGDASNH